MPNEKSPNKVFNQTSGNEASNQTFAVQRQRAPLVPIHHVQQQGQIHPAMIGFNPGFQPAGCSGILPSFPSQFQYCVAAFTSSGSPVLSPNYTGCTFNFYSKEVNEKSEPQKKRRAYIIESDDEDWTFKWTDFNCFGYDLKVFFLCYALMSFWHMTLTCTSSCLQNEM